MAAETLVQVDCAEACIWLKQLLSELLNIECQTIYTECRSDSKQMRDALYSLASGPIKNKRLRIELAIIKEMLHKNEINKIEWVDHSDQIADSLTKLGASSSTLLGVLNRGNGKLPKLSS